MEKWKKRAKLIGFYTKGIEIKEAILEIARDQEIDPRTFAELKPLYVQYGKENVMDVYHELDKDSGWLRRTFGGYKTLSYKGRDFLQERGKEKPKAKPPES